MFTVRRCRIRRGWSVVAGIALGGLLALTVPVSSTMAVSNGSTVPAGSAPYMVAVASSSGQVFCSGVLVSSRVLLTAKHCTTSAAGYTFQALLRSGASQTTAQVVPHPDLDVSALILPTPVTGLPFANLPAGAPALATQLTVRGYGNNSGSGGMGTLREGTVNVLDNQYNRLRTNLGSDAVGLCGGDSGGGLFGGTAGDGSATVYGINSSSPGTTCPPGGISNYVSLAPIASWTRLVVDYYGSARSCGQSYGMQAPAQSGLYLNVMIGGGSGSGAWGTDGGGGQPGGRGGSVTFSYPVTAGQSAYATVGCSGTNTNGYALAGSGWTDGGTYSGYGGGAGGGSSAVCISTAACGHAQLTGIVAVVGGGGGGGGGTCAGKNGWPGGDGGIGTGAAVASQTSNLAGWGADGADGTASSGSGGKNSRIDTTSGEAGAADYLTGGGGGGMVAGGSGTYWGGGCQSMGGGGGGSSWTAPRSRFGALGAFFPTITPGLAFNFSTLPITGNPSPSAGVGILGQGSGKCLAIGGALPEPGATTVLAPCVDLEADQSWVHHSNGQLTVFNELNYGDPVCLSATSGGNGAAVTVESCSPTDSTPSLNWSFDSNGNLRSQATGLCLAVQNASTDDGAAVFQYSCNTGSNELWSVPAALIASTTVRLEPLSASSGRTLTVVDGPTGAADPRKRTVISTSPTNPGSDQWAWVSVDGSNGGGLLRNTAGGCLRWAAVQSQAVIDGACDGTDSSYRWAPTSQSNGSFILQSQYTGECLDTFGGTDADNTTVGTWSCGGGANQAWRPIIS